LVPLIFRRQVIKRAEKSVEKSAQTALVPAQDFQKDLQVRAQKVSKALLKFTNDRQIHVEKTIGVLQKVSLTRIYAINTDVTLVLLQARAPDHQLYRYRASPHLPELTSILRPHRLLPTCRRSQGRFLLASQHPFRLGS
jgi:hypothetical protein